jgi:guanylate kinase
MKRKKAKSHLIAISAPSGAGKTTVCKLLAQRNPTIRISVSATTRPPRKNESDGEDYHFLSKQEFQEKIENGDFIEFERVHGKLYGTLKLVVQELLEQEYFILFDIDVNGAISIKNYDSNAILIFLRPPSMEELRRRLRERGADSELEIEKRLERVPDEYEKAQFFDYDIVNDDLINTIEQIEKIIFNNKK